MSFSGKIEVAKVKLLNEVKEVKQAAKIELARSVILDTPIDSGRARANWLPSQAVPLNAATEAKDKDGTSTIANAVAVIEALPDESVFYLTNNLPYIYPLEYGSSQQSPEGMVRKNVMRIADNLKASR